MQTIKSVLIYTSYFRVFRSISWLFTLTLFFIITDSIAGESNISGKQFIHDSIARETQQALVEKFGKQSVDRIEAGTEQVASLWRESDGTAEEFHEFCVKHFLEDEELNKNADIVMEKLEILQGHTSVIRSRLSDYANFTDRQEKAADPFFKNSIPSIDPWESQLAFFIQLNFPYKSQQTKFQKGDNWSRYQWAKVRIGDEYSFRYPGDFVPPYKDQADEWRRTIGDYFIRMGHLLPDGEPSPFPYGFELNCHHGLRDNIKEDYTLEEGFERQKLTELVIERIINGEVPEIFMEDTTTYWDPVNQHVYKKSNGTLEQVDFETEGLQRYEGFYYTVRNRQAEDVLYNNGTTVISRTFDNAQMTPEQVETMIREFLASPQFYETAQLIKNKLGRDLRTFDIWYSGFQSQSRYDAGKLDSIVKARYPDPEALQEDLPNIYRRLGFSPEASDWLGNSIEVRSVVSGGYSGRPPLPGYKALLTTAFGEDGLDYKGFRIAMHELGHTTEMLYTCSEVEYPTLKNVPTAGITEGVAEYIAYRNLRALGLDEGTKEEQKHMQALATFWYLVDMGGQALTEIELWKWMYENPDAKPEEVKEAVLDISGNVWNEYFAPVFGMQDQNILSIYNHMITGSYYLFNYFVGNVVMFQLYEDFSPASGGKGLEKGLANACAEGNTLPDLWMKRAVGQPISIEPLLKATEEAVEFYLNE